MPQGIKLFATCPRFAEIGQFLKKMDRLVLRFRRTEPGAALIYATTRHQNATLPENPILNPQVYWRLMKKRLTDEGKPPGPAKRSIIGIFE
jgi:hypothetical protein